MRLLWHIGSSTMFYCSAVALRSWESGIHDTTEYDQFHPYLFAWIVGLNLTVYAVVSLGRTYGWFK